jgi:RIO kinase 1
MKVPKSITSLVRDGLVDEVVSRLMSGKEADVYVVLCGEVLRCAKVYKETTQRSFRHRTLYTEGRSVRNSRRSRAMEKKTRYGREEQKKPGKIWKFKRWLSSRPLASACRLPMLV